MIFCNNFRYNLHSITQFINFLWILLQVILLHFYTMSNEFAREQRSSVVERRVATEEGNESRVLPGFTFAAAAAARDKAPSRARHNDASAIINNVFMGWALRLDMHSL